MENFKNENANEHFDANQAFDESKSAHPNQATIGPVRRSPRDEGPIYRLTAEPRTEVSLRVEGASFSRTSVWVERDDFYGATSKRGKKAKQEEPFLVIGFDTEFKTPDRPLSNDEIRDGKGVYEVLSYQVWCKLYDNGQPDAIEWGGVCYPNDGSRLSLPDLLIFAFWKGLQSGACEKLPRSIYLVGHFTRADIPAFSDFKTLTQLMATVRNTFTSGGTPIPVQFNFPDQSPDEPPVKVQVSIRDTMLLTPADSKSLRTIGDLVGVPKLLLSDDPEREKMYKENMDLYLAEWPDKFEAYALNDAVICVRYAEEMIQQYELLFSKSKLPITLTSIGVDLLWNSWEDSGLEPLEILGKEKIKTKVYNSKMGKSYDNSVIVSLEHISHFLPFASECYHGGRNEQFWFGPSDAGAWTDYDLSSAYATAMGIIRRPDWRQVRNTTCVAEFTATTLGVAWVDFEFPEEVRFPTLPVRTDNGLVFPRRGTSYCAAPEVDLAIRLGATVTIKYGVIVPFIDDQRVFGDFIADCLKRRSNYEKKSLRNLFWKEIGNSTYGKTSQGLHPKRVFDLKDQATKPLPPSRITQPFFAAYITSYVRGVLGEMLNSLPSSVDVFSCTTDGFLTNATEDQIEDVERGTLCEMYKDVRRALTNREPQVTEIKHVVRKILGWKTRGQATLLEGMSPIGDDYNIVLAKGGIYTPSGLDALRDRNKFIVDLFLRRTPESKIEVIGKTGIRDMIFRDADLVEKIIPRRLNMEYDLKCRPDPTTLRTDAETGHVAYGTKPWDTIDQFKIMRDYWLMFSAGSPKCIKTEEDYHAFASMVYSKSSLTPEAGRYTHKVNGEMRRLGQQLARAWKHSKAGLSCETDRMSADKFCAVLAKVGIPLKRTDVENAKRYEFKPKTCHAVPAVRKALEQLKMVFRDLQIEEFVCIAEGVIDLTVKVQS